jgi:hypothetical protein
MDVLVSQTSCDALEPGDRKGQYISKEENEKGETGTEAKWA